MSTKQLLAIAFGVALLLLLWGGSEWWSRRPGPTAPTLHLPALSASAVDTIAITHGADTVLLVKQTAGAWTVNRHPAARTVVDDLFSALRDSVRPELAAESPSSFARMGVDSIGGRLVRVVGGGVVEEPRHRHARHRDVGRDPGGVELQPGPVRVGVRHRHR